MRQGVISVIVPVYNAVAYLERCVNSIINQSYSSLEIILVDDGSTDGSGELCDLFTKQDNRIRVIHQQNKGSGAAKNAGFEMMTGEYAALVDSDDWVDADIYQKLLKLITETSAEIAACGIRKVTDSGEIFYYNDALDEQHVYSTLEALKELPKNERITNSMCNKLFRADMIGNLRMNEDICYDDNPFVPQCIARASKIAYTAEPLYNYYQRSGSISHNQFSIKEFDRVTADRIRLDFYHKHFPQCEDAAAIAYIGSCLNVYYHSRHCSDAKKQRASLEKELRMALRSYPNLPFTKKQRSKANLFLFSPILYTLTMSMRGK